MSDFYDNLLKATNNIDDITTEKYATVTKLNGNYCDVKEEDTGLEHTNVPILNGANLSVGDKAIIGFLNNSIYDVVCCGALDKTVHDDSKQDLLVSGTNIKTINHTSLLGSGNIEIQGGGSDVDIVTSWEPTPSDTKVPSEKLTKNTLDTKVDKVTGKGLSTNDFTNSYKNTIDGLSTVATTGDYDDLTNKPTIPSASTTTPSADTTSGSYGSGTNYARSNHTHPKSSLYAEATHSHTKSQITDFPTIPTKTSDLTNDGDGTNVFVKNNDSRLSDARTPTSHNHDDRYYTESEMDTALNGKQDTLVSGTSIKTINNTSLLGSGNIVVGGGGNVPTKTSDLTNDGEDGVNPFVSDDDSRLSDARTPTSHTHTSNQVTDLINTIYPVGSIYMSVSNTSPQTLFGGTWQKIEDTFLLASGSTYANGATGGSADAVVVTHNHTQAQHTHNGSSGRMFITQVEGQSVAEKRVTVPTSGSNYAPIITSSDNWYGVGSVGNATPTINDTGESGTGKNMPPYLAVNVWKRTA